MTDLVDDLAEEFARRCRAGDEPSVEEYAARHPELADEIRAALTAVRMLEDLKPRREDAPPRPSSAPRRLGEFRIVREIGRGGMGVVYEAVQEGLGRRVAVKVLPAHLFADARMRERFRREAQAAARLHHTNIVPVHGVGEQDGLCFYVMQLIDGRGLDTLIRDRCSPDTVPQGAGARVGGPPTLPGSAEVSYRLVASVGAQAADALAHAHGLGVLHRDIKPSNLILDDAGTVYVADFGVAKLLEEANLTQTGDLVGTLRYMPPERFAGKSDERGDLYSLGVTLYEMLTLRPAFPDTTPQHLIQLITGEALQPPRTLMPGIPRDLETIILKAAARDPAHRYQSAADLGDDLRRFLADRPILARPPGPLERAWRWCRRNPALASALAASLVLMLATTVVSVRAYLVTAAANRAAKLALDAEMEQRRQAEETADEILEALNRTYDRYAPTRLVATPASEDEVEAPPPSLPPEAVPLLQDLLRTYERIARSGSGFPRLRARAAEASHRIGDIRARLGQHEAAASAYKDAIGLYEQLGHASADDASRLKLARACAERGRALRSMQKPRDAESMFGRAVRLLDEAPEGLARRPECRYELARSLAALGQRDMMRPGPGGGPGPGGPGRGPGPPRGGRPGPPPGENGPTQRAIALLETLGKEFPTVPEYRHLLAVCYRDAPPRGRGPRDGPPPDRGVDLLRQLVKDFPKVPDYRLDLCEALASGPPERGRFDRDTRDQVEEAVRESAKLAADYPNMPDYQAAHARFLDRQGMRLLAMGEKGKAEEAGQKAFDVQSRLAKEYPDVAAYQFWLCLIERSLGKAQAEQDKMGEGLPHLRAAVERAEALSRKERTLGGLRPFLGMALDDLAQALRKAGLANEAEEARRKAEAMGPRPKGPPPPRRQ